MNNRRPTSTWPMCAGLFGVALLFAGALVPSAHLSGPPSTSTSTVSDQYVRATPTATDSIALEQGWNLVSSRIVPDAPALEDVFADVAPAIVEVRDEQDRVYRPGEVNEIGDWNAREGYEVYASSSQMLVLEGTPLAREAKISLDQGWNTISYLPDAPLPVAEALSSIDNAVVMVKNGRGDAYIPSEGVNQIGDLTPGRAYKVNISQSVDFAYPNDGRSYASGCLGQPNMVVPSDFGPLVKGTVDSLTAIENAATIESAVNSAPEEGHVCLPAGSYMVAPDTLYRGKNADVPAISSITITSDSVTVWGAGREGSPTGTVLKANGTPRPYEGGHLRGNGIVISSAISKQDMENIVLRDFELDGSTDGHTGCYDWSWDADPSCWDISHKGLKLEGVTDSLLVERVHFHHFKGEMLYHAGERARRLYFHNIISEETNASTLNISGNVTVTNSSFGNSRFWIEYSSAWRGDGEPVSTFHDNEFYNSYHDGAGISITNGDGLNHPITFENNTMDECDGSVVQIHDGTGGPVRIRNNEVTNCGGFTSSGSAIADSTIKKNIIVEDNTFTAPSESHTAIAFGSNYRDAIFRNNHFEFGGGQSVRYGGEMKNIKVYGNTFINTDAPKANDDVSWPRPLMFDNTYVNQDFGGTANGIAKDFILDEDSLITPIADIMLAVRIGGSEPKEVYLATGDDYPDGFETTIISTKRLDSDLLFSSDNPTYKVEDDILYTKGDSIKLEYSKESSVWLLQP